MMEKQIGRSAYWFPPCNNESDDDFSACHSHRASVIGAGAWGTTLARHLVNRGLTVKLWAYENEVVESINLKRENALFLPGITLPKALSATHSLQDAVAGTGLIVLAVLLMPCDRWSGN